jgi:SAM-dependent methyltransferase
VLGVEPSVWAARHANDELGLPTVQGTLEDLPGDVGRFDVVCSWDVLEHVSDPMADLYAINRVTQLNGVFAFSTLNWESWPPRVLGERWPWLMDMHLYYFNDRLIEEMLERAGFGLRFADAYCHIITADYLMGKLHSLGVPGAIPVRRLLAKTRFARAYVPFRFGDIQLYVAEKVRELPATEDSARFANAATG